MTTIVIDIETIPDQSSDAKKLIAESIKAPAQMKKAETIQAWHDGEGKYAGEKDKAIEEKWLKTSFDGGYGEIICVCVNIDGALSVFSNKNGEKKMLDDLWHGILEYTNKPFFVAHNAKFDLPFLWKRCVILGVPMPLGFKPYGRNQSDHFCTMESWAGFNGKISLDNLSKILGIGHKTDGMHGSKVWAEYQAGNLDKIIDYCADDVELTRKIYNKMIGG